MKSDSNFVKVVKLHTGICRKSSIIRFKLGISLFDFYQIVLDVVEYSHCMGFVVKHSNSVSNYIGPSGKKFWYCSYDGWITKILGVFTINVTTKNNWMSRFRDILKNNVYFLTEHLVYYSPRCRKKKGQMSHYAGCSIENCQDF